MNKIQVQLACRHRIRVSLERVSDHDAYCGAHGWQRIAVVYDSEVHCFCLDCSAGKWCGQAPSAGEQFVTRHSENNPRHRVMWRWDTVTKDGKGHAKQIVRLAVAREAKMWEDGTVTATQDEIPF